MAADQLMWRTARRYARALLEHSAGSNTTARGAMDAAAAPGSDAEIVCSSGPWGFFCYRKPPDESTPSNTTTIIAPSDSDPAAGGPVGSTMFIVSMSMVAMLIVVSLLASYCTMRHRRRRRSRILAVAEEDRQRQQKEAEGLVREVMIPILVIGPDQSTMHVAFDELHADGDSCDGTCGSSTTCRARQAADAAELLSGTTVPAGTAAVGSEASPEAQQRQQQQQQRKWWQRAAPADPSAHAQAAGSSSHLQRNPPGGLELSSSSGGSGVPSDEHSTAASHSLVQRLRCPASRSVLSVAHAWQETGGDHPLATTGTAAAAAARSSDHHHPVLTGASTGTATDGGPWTGPLP